MDEKLENKSDTSGYPAPALSQSCRHCGRCPYCGRGDTPWFRSYYPYTPYIPYAPWPRYTGPLTALNTAAAGTITYTTGTTWSETWIGQQ